MKAPEALFLLAFITGLLVGLAIGYALFA